jgi:hypothetical protein
LYTNIISFSIYGNSQYILENCQTKNITGLKPAHGKNLKQITNPDATVSLLSLANNKFVCSENNGNSALIANRSSIGSREKFTIVK